MSFNQIIVQGNLGRDPETRYSAAGDTIANFSIAVSKKTKRGDVTTWFRCSAFGKSAEIVANYLKKGSFVTVIGEMQSRDYDKDGIKTTAWEVIVNQVHFGPRNEQRPAPSRYDMRAEQKDNFGDDPADIPF